MLHKIIIKINEDEVIYNKVETKILQYADSIPNENFKICIKDWATMIFDQRIHLGKEKLRRKWLIPLPGESENLLEKKGIKNIPTNENEIFDLIIELEEKNNVITNIS